MDCHSSGAAWWTEEKKCIRTRYTPDVAASVVVILTEGAAVRYHCNI